MGKPHYKKLEAWMLTSIGRQFHPFKPAPEVIHIRDIANALSKICRFGGHTQRFYSVAQHSVLVSEHVGTRNALIGLLHDAPEAYVGDMIYPVKACLPAFKALERQVWGAIAARFNIPREVPDEVKRVDLRLLATERRALMHYNYKAQAWDIDAMGIEPLSIHIDPLGPDDAARLFLHRFIDLTQ
jgi:uncharacterized protein